MNYYTIHNAALFFISNIKYLDTNKVDYVLNLKYFSTYHLIFAISQIYYDMKITKLFDKSYSMVCDENACFTFT